MTEKTAWQWAIEPFRRYADFEGRSPRSEYWWFALGYLVGFVVLSLLAGFLGIILVLAGIVPSIAVNVRRLHDIDKSGWHILIGIVPLVGPILLLVWHCQRGDRGDNQYGPDPLVGGAEVAEVFN